jgi:hypothetical protein
VTEHDAACRAILELLDRRAPGRTICPSEAARVLGGDAGFRAYMPGVRAAAAQLARERRIDVLQRGVPVDLATVRGPVRLRRVD